jgi:hypothetical protein
MEGRLDYLIVGNGPTNDLSSVLKTYDQFIQINDCIHSAHLSDFRTRYIFITNSGRVPSDVFNKLREKINGFTHTEVILVRNPLFYTLKSLVLRLAGKRDWADFRTSAVFDGLKPKRKIRTISFFETLAIEIKLMRLGMRPSLMPSTGLIAYLWMMKRIMPIDTISLAGFTFEGWTGHPWDIEKAIVKPFKPTFSWQKMSRAETDIDEGIAKARAQIPTFE